MSSTSELALHRHASYSAALPERAVGSGRPPAFSAAG